MSLRGSTRVVGKGYSALVTAMTSTVVDDTGPASFAAQLTLNSGIVNAGVAGCAACLTDPPGNTLMGVGKYPSRYVSILACVTNRRDTVCSKARCGQVLLRQKLCPRKSWCPLVHVYISDFGDNLFQLIQAGGCSGVISSCIFSQDILCRISYLSVLSLTWVERGRPTFPGFIVEGLLGSPGAVLRPLRCARSRRDCAGVVQDSL